MDGEGVPIAFPTTTAAATACPSLPPHGPDSSPPVGSPELSDDVAPAADDLRSSQTVVVLTDELRHRIIKQVEYYFSDENLKTDNFLMKHITKDEEGFEELPHQFTHTVVERSFATLLRDRLELVLASSSYVMYNYGVPVSIIASFRKMKKLTRDVSLIVAALKESHLLVISSDDKKVKRLHSLSSRDHELCTILVENLPNDHSTENMQRIFGEAGKIMKITIRDPTITDEPRKRRIEERLLCGKLHAYVEYETIEAAEKAVTTLNNEQDWRYGMRVKLLKRKGKNVQKKKKPESEISGNIQAPDPPAYEEKHHPNEQHDDTPNEEIEEHSVKDKHGYKGRRGGRERRQKYHGPNGHGHGTFPINHAGEISKPPPGPRMPDGTRGFAMGRGRPLTMNQN